MKNKVLLSTLLGSALLVGCTADDALNVEKVAEKVNPAAPVFTISFNDNDVQTRAYLNDKDQMIWEKTDKMSLYHGGGKVVGGVATAEKNDKDNFLASGQVRMFDAIYSGNSGDAENGDFTTQAMVTEGLAIMIYPADTAYVQTDVNPHIFLTNEQNEETKTLAPYVSEVLEITEHGDMDKEGNENSAGFGRKYELKMRAMSSLMQLTLEGKNDDKLIAKGIPAPNFNKVKIEVETEDGKADPFTTEMRVKVGKERGVDPEVGKNTDDKYKYWKYSPWISPVTVSDGDMVLNKEGKPSRTNWISTTDIPNNVAYFTLLPYEDRPDYDKVIVKDEDGSLKAEYGKVTITIETSYGNVVMKSEGKANEDKVWSNNARTKTYNVKDGLTYVLHTLNNNVSTNDLYKGQFKGAAVNHILTVDLSTLDMKNVHVKTTDELNQALSVYEALEKEDEARIILDGDDNGKFTMDYETWNRVAGLMAKPGNKIKFAACNDNTHKICNTIVLENTSSQPVPSLIFDNYQFENNKIQPYVTVELADNSTWTFNATQETKLLMARVRKLVVSEKATLNLDGTTINVDNSMVVQNAFELVNNGKVNVKNDVYLMTKMTNHGTISIPVTGENRFLMYTGGELTNSEDNVYNRNFEDGWWTLTPETATSILKNAGGVIDNHGTLATVTGSGGKIYNYGTINIWEKGARTLITRNQDASANIQMPYSSTNRFGTINLQHEEAGQNNLSIAEEDVDGFIKYSTTKGTACPKANYAVVDKKEIPTEKNTYIEIQYKDDEIPVAGTVSTTALIIPKGRSIYLPSTGASLTISTNLYLKGSITHAQTVEGNYKFVGYFGGDADKDKNNMFSMQ